jgi:uncharacterized repeat protein (TIGR03803 family)
MRTFLFRPILAISLWLALLLGSSFRASAVTVETVYSDSEPMSGLVAGPDGYLYGTTRYGGDSDLGTIFKFSPAGTRETIYSFTGAEGSHPNAALTFGPDGNLYGTAQYGGPSSGGTVFKVTTSGTFTLLYGFPGTIYGQEPVAGLAVAANGVLFGTTSSGGGYGSGIIFSVTTNGAYTEVMSFDGSNGSHPTATLTRGVDGLLYGTTERGGASDHGTVFSISTAGSFASLFSFNGVNGSMPRGPLVQVANGALFGVTAYGGQGDFGTIFTIALNGGSFTSLYSIMQEGIGSNPSAGLALGSDGMLYGGAMHGGADGFGALLQVTTGGTVTCVHDFSGGDGANPATSLSLGSDGNLYGTTTAGGSMGCGAVYVVDMTVYPRFDTCLFAANGLDVNYGGTLGATNSLYIVLRSGALTNEFATWTPVATNVSDASGRFLFSIPINKTAERRFFNVVRP